MKKLVLAMVVLGALAFGNEPAGAQNCTSYQTSGPYYATPSWDQKLVYFQRLICLTDWNNEAVLDRETGLVWQRSPDSAQQKNFWLQVLSGCHTLGGLPMQSGPGNRL